MEGKIQSFETRRLRTCSWRRKGDNLRAREKSKLSRSCFKLSHELMSCLWPVRRSFLTESIVVSVSICEIAYTVSQETFHGFQQISCRGVNNHPYCEGNEHWEPNLALNIAQPSRPCLMQTEITFQLHRT